MREGRRSVVVAAAIACAVSLLVYFPDQDDGSGAILGGVSAFFPVLLALRAPEHLRSVPRRSSSTRWRLAALSLAAGLVLGIANLGVNYTMAALDPAIREQMVTRWAEFSTWSVVISEPIIEEIAYRLVLLTLLAWLASRFTDDRRIVWYAALGASAVLFGVAHIFYGGVNGPLYAAGMAVKTAGAGVLLGWMFWRWGLPYSAVCHCAANAIHLLLMPLLF